jgi:hypothetical protein
MIARHLGIADIATQGVDALVAAYVHFFKIDVPRLAAEVRNPDLRECPLNSVASKPARRA